MASPSEPLTLPATLPVILSPRLEGREAVQDALYRSLLAFDTNDIELLRSAFTPDAKLSLNDVVMDGFQAIVNDVFDRVSKLDTTHFVSNPRIHIHDDGKTASMTATVLSQHYRLGAGRTETGDAPHLMAGVLYRLDLDKETSGLWKIKTLGMEVIWTEGSQAVMHP